MHGSSRTFIIWATVGNHYEMCSYLWQSLHCVCLWSSTGERQSICIYPFNIKLSLCSIPRLNLCCFHVTYDVHPSYQIYWIDVIQTSIWHFCVGSISVYPRAFVTLNEFPVRERLESWSSVGLVTGSKRLSSLIYLIPPPPPGQNGRHFTEDFFRCIFMNEKLCILIKIQKGPIIIQHWFR